MLLPEPRGVQGGRHDGGKGEQLRDSDGDDDGDDSTAAAPADEPWGRKLRRLLEQYVGSEVRYARASSIRAVLTPVHMRAGLAAF